ncbi:MAG: GIY-YIG nuclease family protein [Gammaproteobacteria bacterium]
MSEITLKDLIQLEEPEYQNIKFRIARHVMKGKGWDGFDDLIRFDDELLTVFAGNMGTDRYKEAEKIITCVALPKSKALIRAVFNNYGIIDAREAKKHFSGYERYEKYIKDNKLEREVPELSKQVFYRLELSPLLNSYRNRIVLEWGNSQTYIQRIIEKPISEIYPKGFVSAFPGWDKIHISYKELTEIINNPDGNKDWHEYLTRHSGVYVIFDSSSGMQYVGSASGGDGIWSRWEGYARTGHNGNKALKELAKNDPDFANSFTFSLHHVFPRTVSKNDVLYYESLLKNKLGSRAFGLNEN